MIIGILKAGHIYDKIRSYITYNNGLINNLIYFLFDIITVFENINI